eukprot:CAMPEP_0184493038 /NCGR_PEP_ID=MMETSP0113_2-20130426/24931_1 /TAXON_ID=91329 /ORGANISM="Norrisiella sphaerica, Strain BC52" /LENGTH=293 /DNA_ID=CAMNT_0026878147 /DNA_START=45 /DNA_END=926 /DNA_ORIENTATION=-
MPVIALGTGGYDDATVEEAVDKAFKSGLYHVHTAYDYYNLHGVARGLRHAKNRSDVFVSAMTSPCKHTAGRPVRNVTDLTQCQELTKTEAEDVIKELSLSYIDLLMLHGPSEPFGYQGGCDETVCELNQAQWRAYQELLDEGKVRAIGVSNFCQSCLRCLMEHNTTTELPAVNQIQLHVGMGPDPEGLPSFCQKHGIVVQAYSPLASGGVVDNLACKAIGNALNRTAAQVGLRWVLQQRQRPALVVKTDSEVYLAQDLEVLSWELSDEDMEKLDREISPKGQQDGRPSWGCAM